MTTSQAKPPQPETDAAPESASDAEDAAPESAAEQTAEASPSAGSPGGGTTAGDAPAERDLEAEIADLNDKLLRALAETENLRRRSRKEREDTANYAVAGFARDMLSVADNLGRALGTLPENSDSGDDLVSGFIEGVRLTERELASVLERHGIDRVDPMGEKFDPNLHEAMFEIPTGDAEPGTVVQVVEIGYVLKERLLRAAKVGVARPLPEAEKGEHIDTTA
jgi:molecular chaperone GrpE